MNYTCPKCAAPKEQKRYALGVVILDCGHSFFRNELAVVEEENEDFVSDFAPISEPVIETGLSVQTVNSQAETALAVIDSLEALTIPSEEEEETPSEEEKEYVKQPFVPYQYQIEGVDFVMNAITAQGLIRALIADEMGLGKTAQSLLAIKRAVDAGKGFVPVLAIVTASTKLNWFKEVIDWLGVYYTPQVITSSKDVLVPGFRVYIATHDIIRRFTKKTKKEVKGLYTSFNVEERENPFYTFPFKTIILDEAHKIKNSESARAREIEMICKGDKNIIALSGTPILNNAAEYGQLLTILRSDLFPNVEYFERHFVQTWDSYGGTRKGGLKNAARFRELTKDFIIRRERKDVAKQLPPLRRNFYSVDFDNPKIKASYEAEENELVRQLEKDTRNKTAPQNILAIISRMRHIVGVTKIAAVGELVQEFLLENDRPLVVFCHHEAVLQTLAIQAKLWCYKAEIIEREEQEPRLFHSGLNSEQRQQMVDDFRNGKFRVLIASTQAGGEGINLQFCADVIMAERQWNPGKEKQAEERCLRLGSDKTMEKYGLSNVTVIYPTLINTIDEWFCELIEKKRAIFSQTVNGRELEWDEQSLTREMMNILLEKRRRTVHKGF